MRSCSCVCIGWNYFILDNKRLEERRRSIDPHRKIKFKETFGYWVKIDFDYSIGIATSLNGVAISCCDIGKVRVFDSDGQFLSEFGSIGDGIGQLREPWCICTIGNKFYIGEWVNKRIQIFHANTYSSIRCISTGKFNPLAICSVSNGLVMVTTSQNEVIVFNQEGDIIKRFGSSGTGDGQFNNPRGICSNSRGEVLIVDSNNHRIQVFSEDGQFLSAFGSKKSDEYQFYYPRRICVDCDDNIYVADSGNDRVCIFNHRTSLVQNVDIDNPMDLCLMNGKMIITHAADFISVFSN